MAGRRITPLVIMLAALSALPGLSIDIVLPALPAIAGEFAVTRHDAQLTISAFLLGAALGQLAIGPLADRYGRRPVIMAALAVYIAAAVGAQISDSISLLSLFRFAQGASVTTGFVLSRAIIRDLFDDRQASGVLSKVMTAVSAASVVGPLLGAALVANAEWRTCFSLMSISGALLLACVAVFLRESIAVRDASALRPRRVLGNYRRFFGTRIAVSYAVVNACLYGGLLAYLSGSPFVLLSGVGQVGETGYGALLAVTALAMICGAVANGRLLQRHPPERMIMAGVRLLIMASACLVTATIIIPVSGVAAVISLVAPMSLYALGISLIAPNATAIGMAPLSDMAGGAASIMLSLQAIFGAAAGYLVSLGQDGTPRSIAVVAAVCGFAAAAIYLAGSQRDLAEEEAGSAGAPPLPERMTP